MSRCYPYFRRSESSVVERKGDGGSIDGALIDSFKLPSKNEKPKTEQVKDKGLMKDKMEQVKEKGMEKEKKKVRKQKEEKHYDFSDGKVKKLKYDKSYQGKKVKDGLSDSCLLVGSIEEKSESLDNSGLTEEHDAPMCVYLSDGTQSRKRKRDPASSGGITVRRNILRIRLPSQKLREHDPLPNNEQSCTATVADSRDQPRPHGKEQQYCSTNNIIVELPLPISDSVQKEKANLSGAKTAFGFTSYENETQSTKSMQSLVDDLVSTPLQFHTDNSDDQEWLFGTKQPRQVSKKNAGDVDVSCRQSSSMWPHAQYLREADIYSLPYTIPF